MSIKGLLAATETGAIGGKSGRGEVNGQKVLM